MGLTREAGRKPSCATEPLDALHRSHLGTAIRHDELSNYARASGIIEW